MKGIIGENDLASEVKAQISEKAIFNLKFEQQLKVAGRRGKRKGQFYKFVPLGTMKELI